jgi:hypothetical protein
VIEMGPLPPSFPTPAGAFTLVSAKYQGAVGKARGYTYGTNLPDFEGPKKLPKNGKSDQKARGDQKIGF